MQMMASTLPSDAIRCAANGSSYDPGVAWGCWVMHGSQHEATHKAERKSHTKDHAKMQKRQKTARSPGTSTCMTLAGSRPCWAISSSVCATRLDTSSSFHSARTMPRGEGGGAGDALVAAELGERKAVQKEHLFSGP